MSGQRNLFKNIVGANGAGAIPNEAAGIDPHLFTQGQCQRLHKRMWMRHAASDWRQSGTVVTFGVPDLSGPKTDPDAEAQRRVRRWASSKPRFI